MAIGAFSVGEKPPEVMVPAAVPSSATMSVCARAGARPSGRMPTRWRGAPCSNWSRIAAAPGKSQRGAAALADHPGEAGLDRRGQLVDVVAVEAEARLQPQRIAGAEAGRRRPRAPRRARPPALRPVRRGRRSRTRPRRCSRSARPGTECRRVAASATPMNGSAAASWPSRAITVAAAGPCSASSARSSCG